MDDTWFHSFTAPSSVKEHPHPHRRKPSLLHHAAEEKADQKIEPILEIPQEQDPWSGPPRATLAKRAQSYSDFYHVVKTSTRTLKRRYSYASSLLKERKQEESAELSFDTEFAALEDALLDGSHGKYQTLQDDLDITDSYLQRLLVSTGSSLELLATLCDSFRAVEAQTDAFRQQCESLVNEQKHLTELADAISENVGYYTYLEPMTRRLNAPGAASLVTGADFPEMLSNLDRCLAYMETHPKQLEAATYRSRYRLLLTRGLTLIRHHFTKSLGEIATDISRRIQGGQLKESTHSTLLYAKFRVPAPELKALGVEIQKRAVPTPDDVDAGREPEYASLMRELYQSYATTRGRLMLPLVNKKMAELGASAQQNDVLSFAKMAISFMRGICLDEYDLWFEWFERDGALYDFLESLVDPMYDYLRPKIIRETKLEKLCELCSTIQIQYMDIDSDEDEDDDHIGNGHLSSVASPVRNGRPHGRKLDFASLVQPALEDTQTRLVFLALAVLRDGIEAYKPKPEDLAWPKTTAPSVNDVKRGPVLSGTRTAAPARAAANVSKSIPGGSEDNEGNEDLVDRLPGSEGGKNTGQHQWYPTLTKAVWLLRRIYRLVNNTVFDDLAHRIVHSTTQSLINASQQVSSKKTLQDGQLFLIIHLLNLKQHIVAFDIEFVPPEVEFDFSSVTNTFYEFRERGSLWNPASWVRLVGGAVGGGLLPKVVENMLDAKEELDGRLRTVINAFVNSYADHITAPIDDREAMRAPANSKTNAAGGSNPPFDAVKATRTVHGLAEKHVPALRAKLDAFVADARTRETLVAAVRDQVLMAYEDLIDTLSQGDRAQKPRRKGKAREDEVWGTDLFGEAMDKVFQVGRVFGDDDDENGVDDDQSMDGGGGNVSD